MPISCNGIWQWNLDKLIPYLSLFDGERVCAISTQFTKKKYTGTALPSDIFRAPLLTDSADAVIDRLKDHGFKFIVKDNDPNLQEVLTFEPLMRYAEKYKRPGDFTLWAHAKGVTRFWGHFSIRWSEILYETMLGHWPAVETILQRAPVAGSFLKWGKGWPNDSASQWHYSGSWFWFRNGALFNKPDWNKIDPFWCGIEAYPSLHFDDSEAGCVFHEGTVQSVKLHDLEYMKGVNEELELWKEANITNRTDLSFPESWYPAL